MKTHRAFLVDDAARGWNNVPEDIAHILIEGENYYALRVLERTYTDKIDCIEIDPPYNTGNDFRYNDSFVDGKDECRHSKWLSVMSNRLTIARKLLSNRGIIMIHISDVELYHLKILCDEIFGENNFVGNFIWETKRGAKGVPPKKMLVFNHEYVLCYCKDIDGPFKFNGDERSDDDFSNPDSDPRGLWRKEPMGATGRASNYYDIVNPETGIKYNGNWAFSQDTVQEMIADGKIIWPKKPTGRPFQKKFKDTYRNPTKSISTALGLFNTADDTKNLMKMFGGKKVFDHPKPLLLIKYLVKQSTQKDSIVLDFFAGSGTTGQSVAELNREDGGTRQFILVTNNEGNIAQEVTYKRLEKTIGPYTNLQYFRVETTSN